MFTWKVTVCPVLMTLPCTLLGVRLNSSRPGSYSSSPGLMSMGLCLYNNNQMSQKIISERGELVPKPLIA